MSKFDQYMKLYAGFWDLQKQEMFYLSKFNHPTLFSPNKIEVNQLLDLSVSQVDTLTKIDHDLLFERDRRSLEKYGFTISPERLVMRCDTNICKALKLNYKYSYSLHELNEWLEIFSEKSELTKTDNMVEQLKELEHKTQLLSAGKENTVLGLVASLHQDNQSYINSLIVDESYRRKQVASFLMNVALHSLFLKKTEIAWLEVYRENTAAVKLYLSLGFKIDHSFHFIRKKSVFSPMASHN